MTIKKTTGMCLGCVRFASIDVGFDPRDNGMQIELPTDPATIARMASIGEGDQTGVGFDGKDGHRYLAWGTPDEIRGLLAKNGYSVV